MYSRVQISGLGSTHLKTCSEALSLVLGTSLVGEEQETMQTVIQIKNKIR
jgi:hypothetical protein